MPAGRDVQLDEIQRMSVFAKAGSRAGAFLL